MFGQMQQAFGLDLSDRTIRLAKCKKIGKKIILTSYNESAVPNDIVINGEIQQPDKLIKLIQQLIKTAAGQKIKTKNVISVLPETKTFIKVLTLPNQINKKNLEETPKLIEKEIINHIPLAPEEIYFDWQLLEQGSDWSSVLVGATPKNLVDSYYSVLQNCGLTPYVLEIEAAAIVRSLLSEKEKGAKIIIDFGAMRTGLIIFDKNTIQFTVSLPISGNKITEAIAKTLKLDEKKAEKAKLVCGLDREKCEGAMLKVLMGSINNLAEQIKKAIIFYKTNFVSGNEISEIIICGGGANFLKIDEVLKEMLNLPVKIGNPLNNLSLDKKISLSKNKILSYTSAIGLALRSLQKEKFI
ncbi:MAG: hypothetical protein A2729_04585 [Candidatus Buchananbacteria bacterium RIFCSPHIGHO2_01_FULL_39_14]|uniref:SHS2 domain-containing protein n=2 Tax=Candidatus Buchananiibacteriota TaxID=1817903 RepID=A0A1G1YR85_9BACT|nr:MAG: hypothetical protein A2729_04585 [Candidatus Buchananbacteria bacterium RIFCSPHIGHO2_01_FULL_39_14]OGY49260.1 MAG: hypothetical protein A3D39_03120 [Candidatus Buchananbacteria bacterium RIFCSPHIGHO2_02_FULL_39_17]OGY54326.1 MAG: hypothetical protein A2912_04810 [Candidatus Buchananbacteria bacterium RIFCSPLOWO2_01_FULL_40_23b]